MKSEHLLLRNLSIYGLGGMIAPFIGIKIIDIPITWILRIFRSVICLELCLVFLW